MRLRYQNVTEDVVKGATENGSEDVTENMIGDGAEVEHIRISSCAGKMHAFERREGALNPFDGVAVEGKYSAPAFVDVDNDGDMDLVIGRLEGDLKFYYENTGSASNPSYTRREGALNPFDGVAIDGDPDMGIYSAPAFVDVDNDGDMDLVIGRRE
eukprot:g505.t1